MSTKELVITTRIPLPTGGLFEEAKAVTAAGEQAKVFGDALAAEFGGDNFEMKIETHTRRPTGPRKRKAETAATEQAPAVEGPTVESVPNGADQAAGETHASRGRRHGAPAVDHLQQPA